MAADNTEAEQRQAALARIEGRSPLHDWMRNHRAELEAQFARVRRPNWLSVAKVLTELGVKDAKGQAPQPQTVRQAWIKVRATAPVAPPAPSPPVLAPRRPFDPTEGAHEPTPSPFAFKPARPR
jgi:hypothetical protein